MASSEGAALTWRLARSVAFVLLGAIAFLGAPRAHAQDDAVILFRAPAQCPSNDAFVRDVERLLGRPLRDVVLPQNFHAQVDVQRSGDTFSARVVLAHERRTRELQGQSCDEIANAAAVIVTVAIDPNADWVDRQNAPREQPVATTPQSAVTPPAETPAPAVPWELLLDAGATIGHGMLPSVVAGIDVGVGVRRGLYVLRADFMYFFPRDAQSISLRALGVGVEAGVSLAPIESLYVDLNARFEYARVDASGDSVSSGGGDWFGLGAHARLAYYVVPAFGFYGGVLGMFGVNRPYFDVQNGGTLFASSLFDIRGEIGISVRFFP